MKIEIFQGSDGQWFLRFKGATGQGQMSDFSGLGLGNTPRLLTPVDVLPLGVEHLALSGAGVN